MMINSNHLDGSGTIESLLAGIAAEPMNLRRQGYDGTPKHGQKSIDAFFSGGADILVLRWGWTILR